jgi:hypothetical protein
MKIFVDRRIRNVHASPDCASTNISSRRQSIADSDLRYCPRCALRLLEIGLSSQVFFGHKRQKPPEDGNSRKNLKNTIRMPIRILFRKWRMYVVYYLLLMFLRDYIFPGDSCNNFLRVISLENSIMLTHKHPFSKTLYKMSLI